MDGGGRPAWERVQTMANIVVIERFRQLVSQLKAEAGEGDEPCSVIANIYLAGGHSFTGWMVNEYDNNLLTLCRLNKDKSDPDMFQYVYVDISSIVAFRLYVDVTSSAGQ
jgi:hypothetical protein